jgi:hypothetical protein
MRFLVARKTGSLTCVDGKAAQSPFAALDLF